MSAQSSEARIIIKSKEISAKVFAVIARFRISVVEHSHLFKSELEISSLPEAGEHVPSSVYTVTSALVV